jgi:hypothetical protein
VGFVSAGNAAASAPRDVPGAPVRLVRLPAFLLPLCRSVVGFCCVLVAVRAAELRALCCVAVPSVVFPSDDARGESGGDRGKRRRQGRRREERTLPSTGAGGHGAVDAASTHKTKGSQAHRFASARGVEATTGTSHSRRWAHVVRRRFLPQRTHPTAIHASLSAAAPF